MPVGLGLKGQLRIFLAEPALLWEALLTAVAMRRRGGVVPSSAYLGWRMETAYGAVNATSAPGDLVHYLRWRKRMRKLARSVR